MPEVFHVQYKKLIVPANKQDAYVYKTGSKGLKRNSDKKFEGVWDQHPRTAVNAPLRDNPVKLWIFFKDHLGNHDIPDGILDNNPRVGEFGYTSSCKKFDKGPVKEMVFFLPNTPTPRDFLRKGIWVHPEYKQTAINQLGDGKQGFYSVGDKVEKTNYLGVAGGWKMMGMNEKVGKTEKDAKPGGAKKAGKFEIKVKTIKGVVFPLKTPSNTTLNKVKEKIKSKKSIPLEYQRLFFQDKPLLDKKTLKESGVKHGDTIVLGPMQVYVRNPKSKRFTFDVEPDENIEDLMEKIQAKEGTPANKQILVFLKRQLDPNKTLADYRIKHQNTIDMKVRPPSKDKKTRVFVQVPDNLEYHSPARDKIELLLPLTKTMGSIKDIVEEETGVPKDRQRLFFQDNELDDDNMPLGKAPFRHSGTLKMEPLPDEIQIKTPGGKTRTFVMDPEEATTIGDVKRRIGLPLGTRLVFNDIDLEDDEPLKDQNLKHGDVLVAEKSTVEVDTPMGRIQLQSTPKLTFDDIKDLIEEETYIPKARQRLFYLDEELDDDEVLGKSKVRLGEAPLKQAIELRPPEIEVVTPDGKSRVFYMDRDETVKDFKRKVSKHTGDLAPRLIFEDEELEDDEVLWKTNLKHRDVLLAEPPKIDIAVPGLGKVHLPILPTLTVEDLKEQIEEETGIPKSKMRIFYMDNELEDEQPLDKLNLKHGALFKMKEFESEDDDDISDVESDRNNRTFAVMSSEHKNIEILLPDRTKVVFSVLPTATMADLKKVIEEKIPEMKTRKQRLFYLDNDDELDDDTPISKLNFDAGKPLELRAQPFRITIKSWNGDVMGLNPSATEYIDDVKERIEELKGIPADKQRITHDGKLVDDTLTLEAQGIENGAVLILEPMQVYVDIPNGKQLSFRVALDTTIQSIKEEIKKKIGGFPVDRQCLLVGGGDELEDKASLAASNVDHGDVLRMEAFRIKVMDSSDGNIFYLLDISRMDTGNMIRQKILKVKGINASKGSLFFEERPVKEGLSMKKQDIKHKSIIIIRTTDKKANLIPENYRMAVGILPTTKFRDVDEELMMPVEPNWGQRIFIFDNSQELASSTISLTVLHWTGDTFTFHDVSWREKVKNFKKRIKKPKKSSTYRLVFNGLTLNDKKTLLEQNVQHRSIFVMELMKAKTLDRLPTTDKVNFQPLSIQKNLGNITVHIVHWNREQFSINLGATEYVDDIKDRIQEIKNIPTDYQRLMVKDSLLDDTLTLAEQGIIENSVLFLKAPEINIDLPVGKQLTLKVEPEDTISNIKNQISTHSSYAVHIQCLLYRGKTLENSKTLLESDIHHGDLLKMELFELKVLCLERGRFSVSEIHPQSLVSEVKGVIEKMKSIPTLKQQLRFHDQIVNNSKSLVSQRIFHKSILILEVLDGSDSPSSAKKEDKRSKTPSRKKRNQ
jgi:ubiquitin C